MNKYAEKLGKIAEEFNKPIVEDLRDSINGICKYYQLSKKDLCELCEIDESVFNALMSDGYDSDCLFDLRTISLLTLLSNGNIHTLNDTPDGKMLNEVNLIIKDYQDEKNPPKKVEYNWDEKVREMLKLFGVTNSEDLDHLLNAVKHVRGAINEYENSHNEKSCEDECCCKKDKIEVKPVSNNDSDSTKDTVYVDANGNFHSQKPYTANTATSDNGTIKGEYYDSSTMKEPKLFEFTGNFDKLLPNFMKIISKLI